eukprot:1485247-Rhodomonas_salina.3
MLVQIKAFGNQAYLTSEPTLFWFATSTSVAVDVLTLYFSMCREVFQQLPWSTGLCDLWTDPELLLPPRRVCADCEFHDDCTRAACELHLRLLDWHQRFEFLRLDERGNRAIIIAISDSVRVDDHLYDHFHQVIGRVTSSRAAPETKVVSAFSFSSGALT